jgi:hypothetical protein
LALDRTLDPTLRTAMQHRVNSFSVNPLEVSPKKEFQAALQRYDFLQAAAIHENGPLLRRLERDRRSELARFEATKPQQIRGGIFHYASFGLYTRRDNGDDFLQRLARFRQVNDALGFLDTAAAAGTQPEVAYDSIRIQSAVAELSSLLPEIESPATRMRAEQTIQKLQSLSADSELRAECLAALDALHGTATASGIWEGSGTPETLR